MSEHPPREWVQGILDDVIGGFPAAAEAIAAFLQRYDQSPTLARLADGGQVERDVFKLAVLTLIDELCGATLARVERMCHRLAMQEGSRVLALEAWLARAQPTPAERADLGPFFVAQIMQRLSSLAPPPVPQSRPGGQPSKDWLDLLRALDFVLAHIPELGVGARQRYVAALVQEWTRRQVTAERVRTEGHRSPHHRFTACAATPTLPIDVATLPTRTLVHAGWFGPLHPRETCERFTSAVAAHLHVQPAEARAAYVAAFEADGLLLVLPVSETPRPAAPS
jgi:hypothetical protein